MISCRLPQPRLGTHLGRDRREHAYDPAIPSDGLTLDTDRGPVDLVAVLRALAGQPVPLTVADARYAVSLLPVSCGVPVENAARGLGVAPEAVARAVIRQRAARRGTAATTTTDTKDPR